MTTNGKATMLKKSMLGVLALMMIATVASCGLASSKINELCLIYTGGLTQDAEFEKLLPPGSNNNSIGMGSTSYCYPIDQRSYIASAQDGKGDTGPVEVVSDDDARMFVEYQMYFTLNQEEEVLREFHENLGVKTEAWTTEGWRQLLVEYFEPQIERALESAALKYKWRDMYANEETRKAFQSDVVATVKTNLNEVIGGDYFCGPEYNTAGDKCGDFKFTVGKPFPVNGAIVEAVESEQTAAAATAAQQQKNAQIEIQAAGEQKIVDLYGPEGAVILEAIRSGKVQTFVIAPDGSVTVPLPQG